jgi:hypothetical protein
MSLHDPCVFSGTLREGLPPIYIDIYVDDFKYFSLSEDWCKCVSVSQKLRHINMRELAVRLAQRDGHIAIRNIPGKHNIADLFTKEIKDPTHFRNMEFTITSPRLIADIKISELCPQTAIEGGVGGGMNTHRIPTKISSPVGKTELMPRKLKSGICT